MFDSYIKNSDCLIELSNIENNCIDIVLTSPPYNIGREHEVNSREGRYYDEFKDCKTNEEYINWSLNIFEAFDNVLKKNGVVLYNFSYASNSNKTTELIWILVSQIILKTNFTVGDVIVWKKKSAWPNTMSKNKLTRIWELVIVFCRKDEFSTYNSNKKVSSVRKTGQNNYENIFNFIEAKNNDLSTRLNKCTYSTELVGKLLDIYSYSNDNVILDPFMGTGTTIIECIRRNLNFIGIEISKEQFDFTIKRIEKEYEASGNNL